MTRTRAAVAVLVLAAAACAPAAAYPSPPSPGSEIPAPAAASAPTPTGGPAAASRPKAARTAGAGVTYHQAVRLPAAPVWFHPVPGRCPSTNTGYGGGAFWAGRPYGHHQGQDFAAATGTPIHAIGGGVVTSAGYNGTAGNQVKVLIGDRLLVVFNHLSSIAVRRGAWVGPGQAIGAVGSTGHSTGPHLHIEVHDGARILDPVAFLRSVGVEVACT